MDYNSERCSQHGEQLHDLEKLIYGNGNDGLKLELQRLKDWREIMEKREDRRERKSDAIITALIIQSILMAASLIIPHVLKAL